MTNTEKDAVSKEVRDALNNYYADVASHGLLAEFKYLDSSADFLWVPPSYAVAISYDSAANAIRQNAARFTAARSTIDAISIFPISKTMASYTARIRSVITDTTGNTYTVPSIETALIIKRPAGWKLMRGQTALIK